MGGPICIDRRGAVETIALDRPPVNGLDWALLGHLSEELERLQSDAEVRVVVLTSSNERIFCAGADVTFFQALLSGEATVSLEAFTERSHRVREQLRRLPKPVIAALNGHALGGGLEIALACDFRFLSSKARVGLPEVNLGIIAGGGGTQMLTRIVGRSKALELMMQGTQLNAEEALRLGLVTRVCEPEALPGEVQAFAEELAGKAPQTLRLIKRCVNAVWDGALTPGLELEKLANDEVLRTDDAREGMAAFREKRTPRYTGR